jgi:hypothetical protein
VKADAVAAPISPPAAEGTFEMGSNIALNDVERRKRTCFLWLLSWRTENS